MTTGYDVGPLVPESICGTCGQPDGTHLSVCALNPSQQIGPQTTQVVNEEEKHLGEAV
jgi:hypothetical protein